MLRNFFLINVVLLLVAAFLAGKLYRVATSQLELPDEKSIKKVQKRLERERIQIEKTGGILFDVIATNNLFDPDRTSKTVQAEVRTTPPKNQPKLFGTIIIGDKKTAIIEDPETRATKIYGMNESVAGYAISDIQEDKVVLLWGDDQVVIRLREDKGIKPPPPVTRIQKPATTSGKDRTSRRARQRRPRRPRRSVPPPPAGVQNNQTGARENDR